jgi:S-adenosylmethionine hydrolase
MEYIGTIFGVIIAIIVIVSFLKNLDPKDNSGLQNILGNLLGEQNNSDNSGEVKIYDENGNVINFQNNTVENNTMQEDIIIYDEVGNVMSSEPPSINKNDIIPKKTTFQEPVQVVEELASNADMYHEFIRSNGDSSIVIQEIIGKPIALRD